MELAPRFVDSWNSAAIKNFYRLPVVMEILYNEKIEVASY